MRGLHVLFLLLLTISSGFAAGPTITDGSNFQWGFKESVRAPEKFCFTCSGRLRLVSVSPSYCATCFDVWSENNEECLFYVPRSTKLDSSKAPTYNINVQCDDGATNAVGTVHLSVIPNFPPRFQTISDSITLNIDATLEYNKEVYKIPHVDDDNDILSFTITETPNNGFFRIDNAGAIIAMKSMNSFCTPETVKISMTDHHNPPVILQIRFNLGTDSRLNLLDWNKSITVDENTQLILYITDRLPYPGTCTVTSEPTNILYDLNLSFCPRDSNEYSLISTSTLTFDFEKDPPLNISLTYDNGNCPSNTRWLYIYWNDVPEKPQLSVITPEYSVNEGFISVQPDYKITDEDQNEEFKYSFSTTPNAAFSIHPISGKIMTKAYLSATAVSNLYEFQVIVTDRSGLKSDPVTIILNVVDINDHAPELGSFNKNYQATECNPPVKFAIITATDKDYGLNKEIEFKAIDSGSMLINNNGEVYLTKPPISGQVQTLSIQAVDKGEPKLESKMEVITLIGVPCPTTPAPPTTPPPPPPTTVTTTTTEKSQATNTPVLHLQILVLLMLVGYLVIG